MVEVLLSLGSNINREQNIRSGLNALNNKFGALDISPVYESEAVGFDGDNFFNLVVAIKTELSVKCLSAELKTIENEHGRNRKTPKFSARTLDIDILTFGHLHGEVDGINLPRDEIKKNAFVLQPMADIRPNSYYPGSQKTYKDLWNDFNLGAQKLWAIPFTF